MLIRKILAVVMSICMLCSVCENIQAKANVTKHTKTAQSGEEFTIASAEGVSQVYLNKDSKEYLGLSRVADCFAEDVKLVSNYKPEIVTEEKDLKGNVIIAGSIGNNSLIDNLIETKKINVDNVND